MARRHPPRRPSRRPSPPHRGRQRRSGAAEAAEQPDATQSTAAAGPGRLLVVSTPIGNLGDLTPRAREAFAGADVVACEDTRRTGLLLSQLGIPRPLLSLHEHNEFHRVEGLVERLAAGATVALASDAGTPLVSDPGFLLVRAAIAAGIRVEPVPGAAAPLAALVVSGLPPSPFTFAGFPPPRSLRRRRFLASLRDLPHTLVLFEAPHRIVATLADVEAELGDRQAAVARELTKLHEEVLRGPVSALRATLAARDVVRGEIVLVVAGASPDDEAADPDDGGTSEEG